MASINSRPMNIRLPALGRSVSLGQLYDCRSETLLEAKHLWRKETISKATETCVDKKSSHSVSVIETAKDRMELLGIENDLMVSILCDLVVPFVGTSRCLNDKENRKKVMLKYRCTTKFEELDIESLTRECVICPDTLFEGEGTHVVCGIGYGGQAFIVLDKTASGEELSSIERLLEAVQSLPNFQYDSEGRINIPEDLEEETRGAKYLVYSDFNIPYKPSTYKEAARLVASFPHFVMSGAAKAVPMDIYLYPLHQLDPLAGCVIQNVDKQNAEKLESTLSHLDKVIIECNKMLKQPFVTKFQNTKSSVDDFKHLIQSFKRQFKQQIGFIVTRIRTGTANKNALNVLLDRKEASPFAQSSLDVWIKHKQTQLQILSMEVITSVPSGNVQSTDSAACTTMPHNHANAHNFLISLHVNVHGKHSLIKAMHFCLQQLQCGFLQASLNADSDIDDDRARDNALKQAELFKDFAEANSSNDSLTFVFTEDNVQHEKPDLYISVERDGMVLHETYQLPSKPENLKLVKAFHDRLHIQLPIPQEDNESIIHYEVRYGIINQICKKTVKVDVNANVVELDSLELGSTIEVKVRSICEIGASVWSSNFPFSTLTSVPPGKPIATHKTVGVIHLQWPKPAKVADITSVKGYIITVHDKSTDVKYEVHSDPIRGEEFEFTKLKKTSAYVFSVRAVLSEGETVDGQPSDVLEPTANTIMKQELLQGSKRIRDGTPSIYELQIHQSLQENERRICQLGEQRGRSLHKVILVVGATGAGKTTLINGMINYILGVEWKDNFRFQLIVDSEEAKVRSQAESQTKMISSYTFHFREGFTVPYTLTVIDTPGFGDTSGIKRDREITKLIRNFFLNEGEGAIKHIDVIGFVTQASLPRLTPTQQFIFDQVLALFGNDVSENIFLLVTFADGRKPPVLEAVKKADIPFETYFSFNNSALFVDNTPDNYGDCDNTSEQSSCENDSEEPFHFDEMFWEMNKVSFDTFFKHMNITKPTSLLLTKDVLSERHRLEALVPGIHQHIKTGLNKLEQLNTEIEVLKKHEKDIEVNKKFSYKITEESIKAKDIPQGTYITNCLTCNFTCHYPCEIQDDECKRRCDAINFKTGKCMKCPSRCAWNLHKNMNKQFVTESSTITKTSNELKDRYKAAKSGKITAETLIKHVRAEIESVQLQVLFHTDEIRKCLERLHSIALKPNPLSTVEYIDMLITSELSQNHPRRSERIQQLEEVKKQAEILQQVTKPDFDPFKEYRDVFYKNPENKTKSNSVLQSIRDIFSRFSRTGGPQEKSLI